MKHIAYESIHRQKHFDFFSKMDQPHFSVCANVDITLFKKNLLLYDHPFTPSIVYVIARVANEIPEFRHRIRDGKVVEHDFVHPSFSVLTDIADVFSFCYVDYQVDFNKFIRAAQERMILMKKKPSFEDELGRDDYLFLSAFPWASFTNVNHAMHHSPVDSVPRIVWGKYFKEGDQIKMPLSVQAHHAVVDGIHIGRYFQRFQALLDELKM